MTLRWALAFLVLLAFAFHVQAQDPLYSVVISSAPGEALLVQTVAIDPTSGELTNITSNGDVYGDITQYGVSTFDQKRGIYYFALDGTQGTELWMTDIDTGKAMPSINLGVASLELLCYDNVKDRMLFFYSYNGSLFTLASLRNGTKKDLWNQPANLEVGGVGLDDNNQRLLMLTNATGSLSISILDLNSFALKSFAFSPACQSLQFSGGLLWSSNTENIYTIALAPNPLNEDIESTYVAVINPLSGSCQAILLPVPSGLVFDWTIDRGTDTIYFVEQVYGGNIVYTYDIENNWVLPPAIISEANVQPMNIEVAYGWFVSE